MKMPVFFSRPFYLLMGFLLYTGSVVFTLTSSVKIQVPGPYPTELKSLKLGLQAREYVFPKNKTLLIKNYLKIFQPIL